MVSFSISFSQNEIGFFLSCFCDLELEMEGTVFTPCLEGMKHVKTEHGEMLTKPFLELCKTILPVIGITKRVKL